MSKLRIGGTLLLVIVSTQFSLGGCAFLFAGVEKERQACGARLADFTKLDGEPPAPGFDGRWHCMFTGGGGEEISELLTFAADGNTLTMIGQDNGGDSIHLKATIAGRVAAYRHADQTGFKLALHQSGNLLEGGMVWWGESPDGMTCLQSSYVCRRR